MKRNQNTKRTFDFIRIDAIGSVSLNDNDSLVDTMVYGMLTVAGWEFLVHQDLIDPTLVAVSEVSTGYRVKGDEKYYTVEDALYYIVPFVWDKRYLLATKVDNVLVRTQKNYLKRNKSLHTLAIDVALWR